MSSELSYDKLYIGAEWVSPSSPATITVTSPNTGETIGSVPEAQDPDIDAAVDAARRALPGWEATSPADSPWGMVASSGLALDLGVVAGPAGVCRWPALRLGSLRAAQRFGVWRTS